MTNVSTRMILSAAVLTIAAGVASAQNLTTEIPFSFRVNGKQMSPGKYYVQAITSPGGTKLFEFRSEEKKLAYAIGMVAQDPSKTVKQSGRPTLTFECTARRCDLSSAWAGQGQPAYRLNRAKSAKDEDRHVATVLMRPEKAD